MVIQQMDPRVKGYLACESKIEGYPENEGEIEM